MSVMNIVTACIVILIMAVLSVVAIRFGYKALLIEWAIDAISKAEKEFVGTNELLLQSGEGVRWYQTGRGAPCGCCVLAARKGACTDSLPCDGRLNSQSSPDIV